MAGLAVEITGLARDSADVAQLALRLKVSSYYWDVRLLPGSKKGSATDETATMVGFGMQLRVRY